MVAGEAAADDVVPARSPARESGTTWSRLSSRVVNLLPQYWQRFLSRK
jgi:hypothetical protein